MEKQLEADYPSVAYNLNNLGSMYYQQDKLTEAKKLSSHGLEIRQKILGDDHPLTQTTQEWLDLVQQAVLED
ncbi:tetratricopeptide repeat protein [[Leptolyngbya] sp. PCC 7376]|uniref:tetratricopeptide repeat protein n=1 Tax=[Leptolyngbya] sp. PCC 7376 TaxID=111781 RepID=UPI001CEC7430|nr:tetratricopeptide repeat protein [[Leptolyngbya] sp. PCC 7376]